MKSFVGNNFNVIKTGAFKSLPSLQELRFSPNTLTTIETEVILWIAMAKKIKSFTWKAFENLPLKKLDLSNQNLTQLPSKVLKNLPNVTEIGKPSYKRKEIGSTWKEQTFFFGC